VSKSQQYIGLRGVAVFVDKPEKILTGRFNIVEKYFIITSV
jgi:hypothetical protein